MLKDELKPAGNGLYMLKNNGDHPQPLLIKEGR